MASFISALHQAVENHPVFVRLDARFRAHFGHVEGEGVRHQPGVPPRGEGWRVHGAEDSVPTEEAVLGAEGRVCGGRGGEK